MMEATKVVKDDERTVLDLLDGAKLEPLSPAREDGYCVMRGTIPPGISVPLHSHADAESFYVLSGEAQALVQTQGGLEWQILGPGDFIHIPGGTKHAWRNVSRAPMTTLITCTAKLGRALREMGQLTSKGADANSYTGRHAASPGNIRALWILARQARRKRCSGN